jgi:hypothetical protein
MLKQLLRWLVMPYDPERVLTGSALVAYRQGAEDSQNGLEYNNPHSSGTRLRKLYRRGYQDGLPQELKSW